MVFVHMFMRNSDPAFGTQAGRLLFLGLSALVLLLGCAPYQLKDVLDGPQGKALAISPTGTVVAAGSTVSFTASGGVGPYVYALISGPAGLDTATGAYTPVSAGSAVIRVTDQTGKSVDAAVTVQASSAVPAAVDYVVPLVVVSTPASARMPNQLVNGTFQYRNAGSVGGTASQTVSWEVFASTDGTISANDLLVASGAGLPALGPTTTSGAIAWNGLWPLTYSDYYLLVRVSCAEDSNATNNVGSSVLQTNVGVYVDTEPNNDFTNFVNVQPLGISLVPGMSVKITGSMSATDLDDIFQFDTGTAARVLVTVSWNVFDQNVEIFFLGKANPSGFIDLGSMSGQDAIMSFAWTPDISGTTRWLNLDDYWNGTDYSGGAGVVPVTYTCVITAQ